MEESFSFFLSRAKPLNVGSLVERINVKYA